ncbi:hypothetical protein CHS0354_004661 [Potamilus streckersoni]|uniref:G-protein coupled receptors family 1 profile domain-containing protein n=1 Tax=Potamilus streckersoni TaxID=2493646 RepID=A0AAE0S4Y4_9BIVA|nr:hypothetical protein CHS0354_004661 [Potamilus streckersoni]
MNSEKEENASLSALNDEVAMENIGGAVFVGILMLTGFIGNSHSMYKSSSYRTFVLCLALIDVLACCITMPFVLYMQRYPLMFQNGSVCKIMKLTTYFITIGSATILLIIAIERYRKVCVPHGTQILEDKAKISCVIGLIASFALSWPTLVLYGNKSVGTGRENITGSECDVSDEYWHTPYPSILKFGLLFVFIVSAVVLSIIYSLIWRQIVRRRNFKESVTPSSLTASKNELETNSTKMRSLEGNEGPFESEGNSSVQEWNSSIQEGNSSVQVDNSAVKERNSSVQENTRKNNNITGTDDEKDRHHARAKAKTSHKKSGIKKTNTVTLVLFLITAVFCISFLPHLILRICVFLNKSFVSDMSYTGKVMYNIFRWSFFINHMANPIIYGLYDQRYKSELQRIYTKILYCFGLGRKSHICLD